MKTPTKNPAAVALGRLGGSVKSEKKAAAVRENGKRPKRKKALRSEIVTPSLSQIRKRGAP